MLITLLCIFSCALAAVAESQTYTLPLQRGEFQNKGKPTILQTLDSWAGPSQSLEGRDNSKSGTDSVQIISNDVAYFFDISLGSDAQNFSLIVDTGSYYTWVYSSNCTSSSCTSHRSFNIQNSTSLRNTTSSFDITFTSGDIKGNVVNDRAQFAGFDTRIDFGLAQEAGNTFAPFPVDGIMGLSAKDADEENFPGVINTLKKQNLIDQRVVGINLGRKADSNDEGSVTFGGVDSSKYTGDISYTNVTSQQGSALLWSIPIDGLEINGSKPDFGGSRNAIIDTGTTLIVMPPDDASKFHSYINGSQSDGSNYAVPCSTNVTIEFIFSGKKWAIQSQDFIGSPVSKGSDMCATNVQGLSYQNQNNGWILGDVFLKNVYSVFDIDSMRVGFAQKQSVPTDQTPEGTHVLTSGEMYYSLYSETVTLGLGSSGAQPTTLVASAPEAAAASTTASTSSGSNSSSTTNSTGSQQPSATSSPSHSQSGSDAPHPTSASPGNASAATKVQGNLAPVSAILIAIGSLAAFLF